MNRYKECRLANNMSQKFVALSVGVSPPMVSQWESGVKEPSKETLLKLANLFNVTTDYLLGRDESQKQKETAAQGDDLDSQLVNLLTSLPEKDVQRVKDFVAGLKAAREE